MLLITNKGSNILQASLLYTGSGTRWLMVRTSPLFSS